ncbi:MAG TPA: AraC family transcriptional regulator [Thermomonospora sp.]|nr:AraC family transcriptional regulator [Thermomonospora sp.]
MLAPPVSWTLERNDRRLVFAADDRVALFAETGPHEVTRHVHPVWKLVLPLGGLAEVGVAGRPPLIAPGVLVPPRLAHTCAASSSYVALFVNPWLLPGNPGVTPVDARRVRRLLDALGPEGSPPDLAAARAELAAFTGGGRDLDPRVAYALRECARPGPLDTIAADVGLSPVRLRALVRASAGVPLAGFRKWVRLREAVAELPHGTVARAASTAGFADQAHLTRTARALVGRTPSSLRSTGA